MSRPILLADDDQRGDCDLAEPLRTRSGTSSSSLARRHRPESAARTRAAASRRPARRTAASTSAGLSVGTVDPHAQVHLDGGVQVSSARRRLPLRPSRPASPRTSRGRAVRSPRARAPRRAPAGRQRTSSATPSAHRDADERGRARARAVSSSRRGRGRARTSRWRERRLAEAAHVVANRPVRRRKASPIAAPTSGYPRCPAWTRTTGGPSPATS